MKNQSILILVVSLLITFSLKLYAEEVTKEDLVPIMSSELTDFLNTNKQSKYYLSAGFGKVKDDVVANFIAGYQLLPNLSVEGGLITSAEIYKLSSSSSSKSGTTGSKSWSMDG